MNKESGTALYEELQDFNLKQVMFAIWVDEEFANFPVMQLITVTEFSRRSLIKNHPLAAIMRTSETQIADSITNLSYLFKNCITYFFLLF